MLTTSPAILTGLDYMNLPRSQTWLIEPLLPMGGALTIYGDPKTGKSYLATQLSLALTTGDPFLGFPINRTGEVVYIQLDTPGTLWADRLRQLKERGHPVDKIHQADLETLNCWPFNVMNPEHSLRIRSELQLIKPVAVIVDTFKECHQLNENDATESQKVIAALTEMTKPAALVLLHHSRKPSADRPEELISSARGSGYLLGKMDAIIMLRKKSLTYVGRAIEEGTIRIQREDSGMWSCQDDETDRIIETILAQPGSDREHARQLSSRLSGKNEETCRSMIRRYKASR